MSFFDFCFSSNRERERERESGIYKIWVYRRNSPKVTYLIFRRGSTGESFFFHGLIDFKLFLTLAWRTRVPRVSDILLSSTRNTGFDSSARYEPCQTTNISSHFFRRRGEGCHFRFRAPANHWLLPPHPWSGDFVRATRCHPSQVTVNSNSSHPTSIVSVGYHVTLPFHFWSILMEITHTLPKNTRHTKIHGDSKHNPSHVQQHAVISTSRYAISSPTLTSLNSTSLAVPKANHIPCSK